METLGLIAALLLGGGSCGYCLGLRDSRYSKEALITRRLDGLEEKDLSLAKRLAGQSNRLDHLVGELAEDREQNTALAKDTLALGTELKGGLAALEAELNSTATAAESRREDLVRTIDEQLQGMQTFIVKAAEDARARRNNLSGMATGGIATPETSFATPAPATGGTATGGTGDMAELLVQQRQMAAEFIARRRAQAASNFPGPNPGTGL